MTEEMGGWERHTEGHCRRCSITQGLNREEYCKRCWGKKIVEFAEEEQRRETEAWQREKREKERAELAKAPLPTVEDRLTALEERLSKLENVLGYGPGFIKNIVV